MALLLRYQALLLLSLLALLACKPATDFSLDLPRKKDVPLNVALPVLYRLNDTSLEIPQEQAGNKENFKLLANCVDANSPQPGASNSTDPEKPDTTKPNSLPGLATMGQNQEPKGDNVNFALYAAKNFTKLLDLETQEPAGLAQTIFVIPEPLQPGTDYCLVVYNISLDENNEQVALGSLFKFRTRGQKRQKISSGEAKKDTSEGPKESYQANFKTAAEFTVKGLPYFDTTAARFSLVEGQPLVLTFLNKDGRPVWVKASDIASKAKLCTEKDKKSDDSYSSCPPTRLVQLEDLPLDEDGFYRTHFSNFALVPQELDAGQVYELSFSAKEPKIFEVSGHHVTLLNGRVAQNPNSQAMAANQEPDDTEDSEKSAEAEEPKQGQDTTTKPKAEPPLSTEQRLAGAWPRLEQLKDDFNLPLGSQRIILTPDDFSSSP